MRSLLWPGRTLVSLSVKVPRLWGSRISPIVGRRGLQDCRKQISRCELALSSPSLSLKPGVQAQ